MDRIALGRRINSSRKERGLTGEKLSEACFINATYLRQIEAGLKTPSLPVFVTICQELDVSPNYLLQDTLNSSGYGDIDALLQLLRTASPSQIRLVTAMLRSALDTLNNSVS